MSNAGKPTPPAGPAAVADEQGSAVAAGPPNSTSERLVAIARSADAFSRYEPADTYDAILVAVRIAWTEAMEANAKACDQHAKKWRRAQDATSGGIARAAFGSAADEAESLAAAIREEIAAVRGED